jgi:glycosyltransferase involved in cell wall biosynthesis
LKIAYVITRSDEIGGAHIHVRDMAKFMLEKGWDVNVYVGGNTNNVYVKMLNEHKIPNSCIKAMTRQVKPILDLKAVFELRSALIEFKPDILSVHSAKAGVIARFGAVGLSCYTIFTAHGWSFTDGVGKSAVIYNILERLLAPLTDRIITVCNYDKTLAIKSKITNSDKITVIHNGMPLNKVLRNERKIDSNAPFRLITIARFEKQKDYQTLFESLSKLERDDWELSCVGDGPMLEEMKALCFSLGISEKIQFLGRRTDVPTLLAASDGFLLSSFWEGFPRSILEAMSASLPVIATNVAGVVESVLDGETGYTVPVKDSKIFSHRIGLLLNDREQAHKMGLRGNENFLRQFTFDIMSEKYFQIYQTSVLSN